MLWSEEEKEFDSDEVEPQLNDWERDNIAQEWEIIRRVIIKIEDMAEGDSPPPSDEEFQAAQMAVEKMLTKGASKKLTVLHMSCFRKYFKAKVLPSLREKYDESLLQEYLRRWEIHKKMITQHLKLLGVLTDTEFFSSLDEGDNTLKEYFYLVHYRIVRKVIPAVIKMVNRERDGEEIDRDLLVAMLGMFYELETADLAPYADLEAWVTEATYRYYSEKASIWIQDDYPEYLLKFKDCLRKERDLVTYLLLPSSADKLFMRVKELFLFEQADELTGNSGLELLTVEDLSQMYGLFSGSQDTLLPIGLFSGFPKLLLPVGLDDIATMFRQRVTKDGMHLIQQAENQESIEDFIEQVCELHAKYVSYAVNCFSENPLFRKAIEEAFKSFCNKTVADISTAESLATYFDVVLKKALDPSDGSSELAVYKGLEILEYIDDKDLFAEFYKLKLSHRLLFGECGNDALEKWMLASLYDMYSIGLTSSMRKMLKDMTLTEEHENYFHEYVIENSDASPGVDLKVTVLTAGLWPCFKHTSNLELPIEMKECVEAYRKFFQTRKKDSKLTWILSLGSCHIIGRFDEKPIELVVSTYQGAVLLLFNPVSRLSFVDIKKQLDLDDNDLVTVLESLSAPTCKILNKEPETTTVSATDIFEFNSKFTSKMSQIVVPAPALPLYKERKKIVEAVGIDRRYATEALLVRIMKTRKVLEHKALVKECIEKSDGFKPDIKEIKKSIENLITGEYLERDEKNRKLYRYLP